MRGLVEVTAKISKSSFSKSIVASKPHQDSVWPGINSKAGDEDLPAAA